MKNGYLITNSGVVTILAGGRTFNVTTDHPNYKQVIEALKEMNYIIIPDLVDVGKAIVNASNGKVDVKNGNVLYKGKVIHNSVTKRILNLIGTDLPFEPMVKFLENLMQNPSETSVEELYGFLEANNLPITSDGAFLAYKRVRDDYKDVYTGTIDNSIGKTIKMERNLVNADRNQTCSYGYHACSVNYLSQFSAGSGHIMIVKIKPADVVSVPIDYNNSKLRCCCYEVVDEYIVDEKQGIFEKFDQPLYNANGQKYHNVRDKSGRFTKKVKKAKKAKKVSPAKKSTVKEWKPKSVNAPSFHNVRDKSGRFKSKR
jgi:hypothetical protein